MRAELFWWTASALEATILVRALGNGLIRKYALFYTYIGIVLFSDVVRFCVFSFSESHYAETYWYSELVTILASYAVVAEIFRQSLSHSPGVARFTGGLVSLIFVLLLGCVSFVVVQTGMESLPRVTADVGRYFRYIEGALLLVILYVVTRYRIRLGRNILGLTLAACLGISFNVANLAFWSTATNKAALLLRGLHAASYVLALGIWCVALWSRQPEAQHPAESNIERDYQLLVARTQAAITRASGRLVKVMKP